MGLPADPEYVQQLRGSPDDVGSDATGGVPMTADELAEFERRQSIARLTDEVYEVASARDDFGGAFFDHADGGRFVVLTTGDPEPLKQELDSVEPQLQDDLVVRRVSFTDAQLREAMTELSQHSEQHFDGVPVHTVAVDHQHNVLVVEVAPRELERARQLAGEASAQVGGVPVCVRAGAPVTPGGGS